MTRCIGSNHITSTQFQASTVQGLVFRCLTEKLFMSSLKVVFENHAPIPGVSTAINNRIAMKNPDPFTVVLEDASQWALAFGHREVTPAHLLCALVASKEPRVQAVLWGITVNTTTIKDVSDTFPK